MAATTAVLRHRRDTATNWTSNNPTMLSGQLGYETDTLKFKFGDGTTSWASLSYASSTSGGGGGVTDGDKGDIVVSGSGATWTVDTGVITTSKMGGDVTTAGKALLDDADATAQRVTLGLGSIATQNSNAVSITGGTLTGVIVSTGAFSSNVNEALMRIVRKSTAGTITKGQALYVVGSTGTHFTVELADASVEATAATTIGVAAETITNTTSGYMIVGGLLNGLSTLPTASFTDGAVLWLSETAGELTTTRPTQPAHGVAMGWVINASNGSTGAAYIKVINGQQLNELHDVLIISATNNDTIMWDSASSVWKNKSPTYLSSLITGYLPLTGGSITGVSTISVNSTSDALRINQLNATGNALVVEDETNPDSTPFVINASGAVITGTTTAQNAANAQSGSSQAAGRVQIHGLTTQLSTQFQGAWNVGAAVAPALALGKSRGTTVGDYTAVVNADVLGYMQWQGTDGTTLIRSADIRAIVDGTVSASIVPSSLYFRTTNSLGTIGTKFSIGPEGEIAITGTLACTGTAIAATPTLSTHLTTKNYVDTLPITTFTGGNWKILYTNGTGVTTELALGASGTVLQSNGATSAPTFVTPSGGGGTTSFITIAKWGTD